MTCAAALASAQIDMPNPREMSGVPLPSGDLPAGTISVRVIRGSLDNNIAGQLVEFEIDGKPRSVKTDASGRAQVSGLRAGSRVRAVTTVDGERLVSQDITIGSTGIRMVLVATDPDAARRDAESKKLAEGPAVPGTVVLGPESRIVAELTDDVLRIFYVIEIVNTARTPVETGGPLVFDLPRTARGAAVLQGSSKQATAKGPRVIVTSPFAPGKTMVQIGYQLPYGGSAARIVQRWPAALQQLTVLVLQVGGLQVRSPQIAQTQNISEQGQQVILGTGPAMAANQTLELEIIGLPHHAAWPRYIAVSLALAIMAIGVWAAVFNGPRRRHAAP
jgi:hypothetical protein